MNLQLDISDWINVAAVIVALFVGVISIIIALFTLRQNSKMIEESTRPYIALYSDYTYFQNAQYYVILKNFGNTGEVITKFESSYDLGKLVYFGKPFEHIVGTFVAPNQSFKVVLSLASFQNAPKSIDFEIEYKTSCKTYVESITLNINATTEILLSRANTKDKELQIISYALQDLCEKHM